MASPKDFPSVIASVRLFTKSFLTDEPISLKVSFSLSASSLACFSAGVIASTLVLIFPFVASILFFASTCLFTSSEISLSMPENSINPSLTNCKSCPRFLNGFSRFLNGFSNFPNPKSIVGILNCAAPPSNFLTGSGIASTIF